MLYNEYKFPFEDNHEQSLEWQGHVGSVLVELLEWELPVRLVYVSRQTGSAHSRPGFDGIWTPPPCKDTNAQNNMGYTPYDYYDIGQKNQKGAPGTRFGTQDFFH
jgi:hypothetical protein